MSDWSSAAADVVASFRRMAEDLEHENERLRMENHRLHSLVDAADRAVAASRTDDALRAQLSRALDVMAPIAVMLSRATPADNERKAFADFFAYLVEHNRDPGAKAREALMVAYAKWEEGRR